MSLTLHGIPASKGIAIAPVHLLKNTGLIAPHYHIETENIQIEQQRFLVSLTAVQKEFQEILDKLAQEDEIEHKHANLELSALIQVHLLMLEDPYFSEEVLQIITTNSCNAEWALVLHRDQVMQQFALMEDVYLQQRSLDIKQISDKILAHLMYKDKDVNVEKIEQTKNPFSPEKDIDIIIVAHDISPADVMHFKNYSVIGLVTDVGGMTSHTAILARSMGIPAVLGVGSSTDLLKENELLIIDGDSGVVLANPSELILKDYEQKVCAFQHYKKGLEQFKIQKISYQKQKIHFLANIEQPQDIHDVLFADGIGLFRTEFLFLDQEQLPDEEKQFQAYLQVVQAMPDKPITFRTIDIGGDKPLLNDQANSLNPALGRRAIRYSLAEPEVFLLQLQALLRVASYHQLPIKILLPMISSVDEILQAKKWLKLAQERLQKQGIPIGTYQLGAMIEIPAAALSLDLLLPELDFISIGTNDLTQYTLAIDRGDPEVAHLYNPEHPAVVKLIELSIKTALAHHKEVSLCGELAGMTQWSIRLLEMGLLHFSMNGQQILAVKSYLHENTSKN